MAQLQPQFTKTPTNPTQDTFAMFWIGLDKGGWGNDPTVVCTVDGGQLIQTVPTGSKDFAIQFDDCPVGHHAAHFSFERGGAVVATLDYEWDVVA